MARHRQVACTALEGLRDQDLRSDKHTGVMAGLWLSILPQAVSTVYVASLLTRLPSGRRLESRRPEVKGRHYRSYWPLRHTNMSLFLVGVSEQTAS
jgi:hypothetical protein